MSNAPVTIWAFYAPEIEADEPGCTIVAGEQCRHGATQYTRTDTILGPEAVRALVGAARAYMDATKGKIERSGDFDQQWSKDELASVTLLTALSAFPQEGGE